MAILTPNMNLYLPTIGVDSGLVWEQDFNANASILDGHNHAIGSGVQIGPSGLNMNADLPMNDYNLISVRSTRYAAQLSPISQPADLGCTYVSGVDLYYNDVNGNQIQITAGGTVNATSSGISSGTATASFSSSTLVVNAASNTPANIKGASLLLGNTGVSGSDYLTLSPPSALATNYSLTLPAIPAQTNVMTLDTSGNMSSTTWNAVGQNMTATGANAVANSRTRATGSSTEGTGGVPVSSSSGSYSTSSGTLTPVTNLSVTLTTTGRPVFIGLYGDGNGSSASYIKVLSGNALGQLVFGITSPSSASLALYWITGNTDFFPPSVFSYLHVTGAGTYTYVVSVSTNGTIEVVDTVLVAYEI